MKRNIKSLIALFAGTAMLTACESLLDVNPTDRYSADTFFQNEAHVGAALSGCYQALLTWRGQYVFEFDMMTSNAMPYNEANGTQSIAKGEHLPITAIIGTLWQNCYRGIGRTNTLLDKIDGAQMDENLKKRMKGEALFLRAFFYSEMVNLYGGVPLILETPNAEAHSSLPRDTKQAVVDQILKDLTDAAALLPNSYTGSNLGRATKGAALSLKARMLLYDERWSEAAATAKSVMDMGVYRLFGDYRNMFSEANKHNSESIFNIESAEPDFTTNYDNTIVKLNRPAPLKELVDKYQMTDGKSIDESPLYDPAKPYENRDPRLHYTVVCIGYPYNGKITTTDNVRTTGFGHKKYTSYSDNVTIPEVTRSSPNIMMIRYAEVLLTYAEAQNEASGPDESVYAAINQVRQRTGVNMPVIPAGLTKEQMREAIRLERRIELAMEGLYYNDVRRWKTIEQENNGPVHNSNGVAVVIYKFNPARDYLWPVPYNQIVQNPALEQNDNWD
jgi:hypothetical protein